ncbi:MAG TPA: TonB-dependent receptor [Burkholderiaceae bacterium]|nr:TonB-dependent receptor [Burkholderiaceae bacterium]
MASITRFFLSVGLLAAATASNAQSVDSGATAELPKQTVVGHAPGPATEPAEVVQFSDAPLGTTPAAVDVVDTRDLREAGVRSLSAMARGLPWVRDAYNTVGYIEDFMVRGFLLDSTTILNYQRNGLPVSNYAPIAFENKEEVQILRGLNGALAGASNPGGIVDYITKRPAATELREANAEVSERGTWIVSGDISERTGPLGYRFNLAAEERRPIARDAPGSRLFAAGAMDLKLPNDGLFQFEIEWQHYKQISVPGFGLIDKNGDGIAETLPAPIDPRINLNNQPWSLPFESRNVVGTVSYEQPVSAVWNIGVRALVQRILTNDRIAFPDGCSSGPVYVYPGLCGNYDVDIYDYRSNDEVRRTRSSEAYAIARFDTAGIGQRVQFGARVTRYSERLPPLQAYNFVGTENVFAPVDLPPDPTLSVVNTDRDVGMDELYAYDTLQFGPAWSATIGARYIHYRTSSTLNDGTQAVALSDTIVTPWGAVGWKPWTGGYFYLSAGTGIQAEVVPNRPTDFANAGQVLPVGHSRQVELGYKQALGVDGHLDVALFDIHVPYAENLPQASGPPLRVANTRTVEHRGVEIALAQSDARSIALDLKATYLDARIDRSIDPTLVGKRVTNVPEFAAALGANLRPLESVDLWWRNLVTYTSTKEVLADNSVALPSSWQWDTALLWSPAAAYPRAQLRFGVDNVTNRHYWREAPTASWGATYLFPAQPRTYRAGVTVQW